MATPRVTWPDATALAKPGTLTLPQLHLLKLIDRHGRHPVGEVADLLGVSAPAATRNVDKLERLGLLDAITSYSYMRGALAHLEEDCDASTFQAAAKAAGLVLTFREHNCPDRYSRIRNYDPYSPERARRNLSNLRGN